MKRYILPIAFGIVLGTNVAIAEETEQSQAQIELNSEVDEGLVKFKSQDGKYSFRVGARVDIDGSLYFDDYTDRGSGAEFSTARLRVLSKLGDKFDFKFDVDFMSKTFLKDAYLRWHTTKNSFLRLGNFAEAFSAENIQSTMDYPFITKSATTEAFGTGRALGLAYRYYHPYFWGEAGVYSQKLATTKVAGDMGYSVSTRLLARYTSPDFNIHVGGSFNFRRPNANGFSSGNDDYNRTVTVASSLESAVDETKFMSVNLDNVKNQLKWGVELMANYKNVYLKGEYIGAKYNRERDWENMFNSSLGTMMAMYFPTMESYKWLYGEDVPAQFYGVSVEAGVLLFGGDYKYNSVDALMRRPKGKSLELVARFNHTNLNDITSGSIFYNGSFYDSWMNQSWYVTNQSVAGGKVNTLTIGLNYYVTNNIVTRLDYSYQHLNQPYVAAYSLDKNLHSIQARVAFEF
jgi:phosphate-selective porin OprO/OprP